MKPISELPHLGAPIRPSTQQEVQFYTAMWTIANAARRAHGGCADERDLEFLAAASEAQVSGEIKREDNLPIKGDLARELDRIGLLRKIGKAKALR
jgi:hypothetical protein